MKNLSTEEILSLVNLTLIEGKGIHYHYNLETQFYNQCHSTEDGKFCSGSVSGSTTLRDTDGTPTKGVEIPAKRGKKGASLADPHEGTREIDGVRGYDKRTGKPVPGTDAYLEAHNIPRDIFENRPYVKYEASKTDEALIEAYPKDKPEYAKGRKLFTGTAEDKDPEQTGGYIMYKSPAPGSPHGDIAPQIRPNAPVVTDKGARAKAKTILENSQKRFEILEKTSPTQLTKERRAEVKRAKVDLERAQNLTPEIVKEEATKNYDVAKANFKKLKAAVDDPDIIAAARKDLNKEKRDYDKTLRRADNPNFKEATIETKTLHLKSAENQLQNSLENPQKALDDAIRRQKGTLKREQSTYDKTAAKYLFTPGVTSARIDVSQDPQNIKNLVKGKGRIYLAMEGSIKNDAILAAIRKEDPTASVVNVPSVTLWQQKNLAPEIPSEIGWFAQKYAKGRDVILIPDADGVKNNAVMSQAKALKSALLQNGAGQVYLATPPLKLGTTKVIDEFKLPSGKLEERKGIDDHLGAGRGTLGQLRYKTFTEYPDYDLTHLTKAGGAAGKEKMSAGAKGNAEKVLAAISGLVEDKGVATIPLKTLNQTAGFRESQRTSARDARNTLERLGVIKVEYVYDSKALGRGERVLNPTMSVDRRDELVRTNVIKEPHIYRKYVEVSFDESPVITILNPKYIIRKDRIHTGSISELPSYKPPTSFKGWTSAVTGRPDTTGIAAKQESNHIKFIKKNAANNPPPVTVTSVKAGRTTKERLAEKKAPPGRRLVRSKAGAKRYGVGIGQTIPLSVTDTQLHTITGKLLTTMVLLSSVMSEEELVEFYNKCHDEDGRFCEGEDGSSNGETVSGEFLFSDKNIRTVAKAGVGSVEVDGIKAKAVYEIKTKDGQSIRLYDKAGNAGKYKDKLLESQAQMHNLYPLQPPRNIVVAKPDGLFRDTEVPKDTFAIVYGDKPNTYVNSKMLGINVKKFSDGFQMPSAKTGDTSNMDYLLTHEYGHHVDFAQNSNNGYSYNRHPLYDNSVFKNSLSRYGRSDARGIESYAEAFAEWHHSGGQTKNPAAAAMAKYEGWASASIIDEAKFNNKVDPHSNGSETISLTLLNPIHLTEGDSVKTFPNDTEIDINADLPVLGDHAGIAVVDSLTENGPKTNGHFETKEPSKAEIAKADKILREVYEELGLEATPEGEKV